MICVQYVISVDCIIRIIFTCFHSLFEVTAGIYSGITTKVVFLPVFLSVSLDNPPPLSLTLSP
jgi:hypothetical protein